MVGTTRSRQLLHEPIQRARLRELGRGRRPAGCIVPCSTLSITISGVAETVQDCDLPACWRNGPRLVTRAGQAFRADKLQK